MLNWVSGSFINVINLANSIIGVSILAMPYCFQKCGILLSILLIVVSGTLVRVCCYLLLKCAIMARRRTFENLAFHAFGYTGKLAVEIGVIGFLIGVCIAFFVVIGDLGPPLASEYMMVENTPNLRAEILVFLGFFVALPLGLLKNVNSLTSLSAFSIAFYGWLVLKIFSESTSQLALNEWWHEVNWWQMKGLLPCLPIFSMALSCQTQLFEFFDTLGEPSLKRMMSAVNGAVFLCSAVYILVGLFGYIACHDKIITGNILVSLAPSVMTECIKLLFVFTVVISFPLCLFPCRTSLHSLLFKQSLSHHEITVNFIPDHRFKFLTISLVIITIGVSIMIPNIEFALGIIGSTIGTMICLIFPALVFIHDTNKNTFEKRMAQVVMCIGLFILFACTYSTLQEATQVKPTPKTSIVMPHDLVDPGLLITASPASIAKAKEIVEELKGNEVKSAIDIQNFKSPDSKNVENEKRQEPPIPHEPESKVVVKVEPKVDLDPQALQKEDKEIQKESVHQGPTGIVNSDSQLKDKQEQILKRLEEQQVQQKIILEQQQQVLKELIKHQESHDEKKKELREELLLKNDLVIAPVDTNIKPDQVQPEIPVQEKPKTPDASILQLPIIKPKPESLIIDSKNNLVAPIDGHNIAGQNSSYDVIRPILMQNNIAPKLVPEPIPLVRTELPLVIPNLPAQLQPAQPQPPAQLQPAQPQPPAQPQLWAEPPQPQPPAQPQLRAEPPQPQLPAQPRLPAQPQLLTQPQLLAQPQPPAPPIRPAPPQPPAPPQHLAQPQPPAPPQPLAQPPAPPQHLAQPQPPAQPQSPAQPHLPAQPQHPESSDLKINVELKLKRNLEASVEISKNNSKIEINNNASQKPLDENNKHEM